MALTRSHDREIVRLAVPAFLALVAEPLFLLADAAIVGHLGTESLAGRGVAAVVLQTGVGLCVFHAYGTNLQFGPDDFNFVKERARHGVREAFAQRDEHFHVPER